MIGTGLVRGAKTLARLRAEVDEFGRKAEFVIDDFGAETPAFMQGRRRRSLYGSVAS